VVFTLNKIGGSGSSAKPSGRGVQRHAEGGGGGVIDGIRSLRASDPQARAQMEGLLFQLRFSQKLGKPPLELCLAGGLNPRLAGGHR
jgi:hypothetical protein